MDSSRVLVFQAGGPEPLAIHLQHVLRVEVVSARDLERVGGVDCIRKNHNSTIRLVLLADLLPINAIGALQEEFFLIVPRPPYDSIGFVATRIIDSADLPASSIERGAVVAPGLSGSSVLFERLTLVLDFPSLMEMLAAGGSPASLLAEGRFLLTTNSSLNQNHPIKQLPANAG